MTRATLFDRLKDVVPRVSEVNYQKPNKGYVKLGFVYAVSVPSLFKSAKCKRRDFDQVEELIATMKWLGFAATKSGWTAVHPRKRGQMFTSKGAKKKKRRIEGHAAVLRFRARKYAAELKELGDEG